MASSSSTTAIPSAFSVPVREKLTKSNYLLWHAHAMLAIHAAKAFSPVMRSRWPRLSLAMMTRVRKCICTTQPTRGRLPVIRQSLAISCHRFPERLCGFGRYLRPCGRSLEGALQALLLAGACTYCEHVNCASNYKEESALHRRIL
jgi:hypothetical protein